MYESRSVIKETIELAVIAHDVLCPVGMGTSGNMDDCSVACRRTVLGLQYWHRNPVLNFLIGSYERIKLSINIAKHNRLMAKYPRG